MVLVRNGHHRKRSLASLEPNSAERPIDMASCDHDHPTIVDSCAVGQCVGPRIAEELQAIGPYLHANGTQIWATRLEFFGYAGPHTLPDGTVVNNSRMVVVAAGHIDGPFSRIRFQGRKGAFTIMSVGYQDHILPQPPSFVHSDNIIGNPASLSDKRLKEEIDPVSGAQALDVLSQIQGCTYEREDLQQRRLGLIADEVEAAIVGLGVDNVCGSKWHNGDTYRTLDYGRLVALLIPAVNNLSVRLREMEARVKEWDSTSQPS